MNQYSDNKKGNYSPSTSFNYPHAQHGHSHGAGHTQPSGNHSGNEQPHHPRRRTDRFRRETFNIQDKVVKQNDIMIRLLKEIRDRLPPLPADHIAKDDYVEEGLAAAADITAEMDDDRDSDSPDRP